MSEVAIEAKIEVIVDDVSAKELLLLSIPLSIFFALTGMDFIGYFIYIGTRSSVNEVNDRGVLSVLLLSFLMTTIVLCIFPLIGNKIRWQKPLTYFGTQKGNRKLGLIAVAVVVPMMGLLYFNTQNQPLINIYPLTKDVLPPQKWIFFVLYELSYIIFYYIPYEFYFRGVLQLGLSKTWKKWQSILFVTVLTTVLHIAKPYGEIISAFIAGFLLGILAEKTQSWYYGFFIHIAAGVLNDTFCALGHLGVL
ncbi:MAG: CPBP family intramembrane glutamic endopeptidase [Candidatus Heimdallarchaeota archaeon]